MNAKQLPEANSRKIVPTVGIGASAGGLEAFIGLLSHLPNDTGLAFVLVQHLDPDHESALVSLLRRATSMPVTEVSSNTPVEANHVFVIAPNTALTISKGILIASKRATGRGSHNPFDRFLETLAIDQGEHAIGVVLSGAATDGTLGLELIKAEGGITFAQDESAKYDSMPRSAIASGCIDLILPPDRIAFEIARIAGHPVLTNVPDRPQASGTGTTQRLDGVPPKKIDKTSKPSDVPAIGRKPLSRTVPSSAQISTGFDKIVGALRTHSGVDFSLYKSSTILRRIERRAVLTKQQSLDEYAKFLRGNSTELDALYFDMLIGVTSFFRNPEAFEVLKRTVFPKLVENSSRGGPVRIWVLGCSTGQEAYSIAMAFAEFADHASTGTKLQIFATDLNEASLEKARNGLYAKALMADVSQERRKRFFAEEDGGFRISKALREQVVFARQNVLADPPFSRMDLISCRNLLIYLDPDLQRNIVPAFHYSLRAGGFLFLGASESVSPFTELFYAADKKQKIFTRKPTATPAFRPAFRSGLPSHDFNNDNTVGPRRRDPGELPDGYRAEVVLQREADRILLNEFAPPGVLVNSDMQILQFRGATASFLEPPKGKATFDLLKMAREGLLHPLRSAMAKAKKEGSSVLVADIHLPENGGLQAITLQIIPLNNLKERCYLVLFLRSGESPKVPVAPKSRSRAGTKDWRRKMADLERELFETQDYLQSIHEQYESTTEELQATGEEAQSANEELQSINEELETSKEELESSNEELMTLNEEMAHRNIELNQLNADLTNLQLSIQTPILVLNRDLTVRRFTPVAETLFNLRSQDIGRSLATIRHELDCPDLTQLLIEVIHQGNLFEREIRDKGGRWLSLRIRPYLTVDDKIDGAVLMLTDIDSIKRSEQEMKVAREYAEATVRTSRLPLLILRNDLTIDTANEAFYRAMDLAAGDVVGQSLFHVSDGVLAVPKLQQLLNEVLPTNSSVNDFELAVDFPGKGMRKLVMNASRLKSEGEAVPLILLSIDDVTERDQINQRLRAGEEMRQLAESLEAQVNDRTAELLDTISQLHGFTYTVAHDLRQHIRGISLNASSILHDAEGTLEQSSQDRLHRLVGSAKRLSDFVDSLLAYTRLGRQEPKRQPVDLSKIAHEIVTDRRWMDPGLGQVSISIQEGLDANGDDTMLRVVIGNLLDNAFKFSSGVPNALIEFGEDDQGFFVRDNGVGFEMDHASKLFEPFERLHAQSVFEGSGIGLANAKRIIDKHGGRIWAEGAPGKGATFHFRL